VKDCFLANSWKYSTQYVAIKTAQNDFYNCTFSRYNCTIRHQLHTKICPDCIFERLALEFSKIKGHAIS